MFASEIKALLAAGARCAPNWNTWAQYLVHGIYDHSSATFFEGVHCLPAGHYLTLEAGKLQINEYWSLAELAQTQLDIDDEDAASRWMELFRESVRLRLRSDVPLGINLSGGLDSASLLVTVDQELRGEGLLQTFTASFDDPEYDESEFAGQVPVSRIIERNIARLSSEQVWRMLEEVLWHQEAPFGGVATIAYHSLHQHAQQKGIKVLLEGQGVDEMLAGYGYFRPYFHCDLLRASSLGELRRELRADSNDRHNATKTLRSLPPHDHFGVYQDGTTFLQPQCVANEIIDSVCGPPEIPAPFSSRLQNALFRDIRYTKLPRVLRMNDRLSMASSRELREPYLDHRLVELSFRLSGSKKIRNGKGKYLLRRAMSNHLPSQVCWASKRSVVTPQREWLTGLFKEQVMEIIGSRSFSERGLFNIDEVMKTYRRLCDDGVSNTFAIWQWINTELWFRFADSGWRFAKSGTSHWR
jgi:asparagine synthase (glutamine-hydrolysing)